MALLNDDVIVFQFSGRKDTGVREFIKVKFNTDNEEFTALTATNGIPRLSYYDIDPPYIDGEEVAVITNNTTAYHIHYTDYYPFAYFIKETIAPPVITLTVNVAKTNETAPNERDGTATITATGSTSPFQYSLDNLTWQFGNIFTNLLSGNYIAYVIDGYGNLGQAEFQILQGAYPPLPPVVFPPKDIICLSDGELDRKGGYKRTIVKTNFGGTPTTLYNGDFEEYDGQNWGSWTKYGGINLSRGQRTVKDRFGNIVPISNYTLLFNEKANSGKYIEHTYLPVKKGDTGNFIVNIGNTLGTGRTTGSEDLFNIGSQVPVRYFTYYEYRMRIKAGNYYLYNESGSNNFSWVNQIALITGKIDNSSGDVSSYTFNFSIPEIPESSDLVIQIFGFMNITERSSDPFQKFIPYPATFTRTELNAYTPVEIDDIKLSISSKSKDNDVNGIVNISDNLDYFTKPLEQVDILYGDLRPEDIAKKEYEKLWGIYDQDGVPTKEWIEYGVSTKNTTLGLATAKSIMQSYQASYYLFKGSLMLEENAKMFSYLDTYSFLVNMKLSGLPATDFNNIQFVLLGGDIDLKFRRLDNIEMREYFRRIARTTDVSIPVTNNTPLPPISNDPNNIENVNIFTEEFDETYK